MPKATKGETEKRILYIVELIAKGMRPVNIKQDKTVISWGVKPRRIETLISDAYAVIKERAKVDTDREIGDAIAKYDYLIEQAIEKGFLKTAGMLIDKRAELIGLKTFRADLTVTEKVVNIELVPTNGNGET
jgi:hypothetical protein